MTNNATIETAKGLTFGTELEYTNITREKAAKAIHSVVGGTVRYYGGGYDAWQVTAPDGRIWKAVRMERTNLQFAFGGGMHDYRNQPQRIYIFGNKG